MHDVVNYRYNRSIVSGGVSGVLTNELDAFIYDGTVLDYLVSQVSLSLRYFLRFDEIKSLVTLENYPSRSLSTVLVFSAIV